MDDTIYLKTPLGQETIQTRNAVLSRSERSILIMVDGKKTGAELVRMGAAMGMTTDAAALVVARIINLGMVVSASSTLTGAASVAVAQPMKPLATLATLAAPTAVPTAVPAVLPVVLPPPAVALAATVPVPSSAQAQADTVAMKAMSTTAAIRIVTAAIQASAFVEPVEAGTVDKKRPQTRRKDEFLDSLADQVDSADAFESSSQLNSQFGKGALTQTALEGPVTNSPSFANFAEQFDVILGALAAEIHSQLGLRGMDLSVKADNAHSVDELKSIAKELYQVITRSKGASAANNTQSRLDGLFEVPVAHPPH